MDDFYDHLRYGAQSLFKYLIDKEKARQLREIWDDYQSALYSDAYKKARNLRRDGIERAIIQCILGYLYLNPKSGVQDYHKAFKAFSLAADCGIIEGAYWKAMMLLDGAGCFRNYKEAYQIFDEICHYGDSSWRYFVGCSMAYSKDKYFPLRDAYYWISVSGEVSYPAQRDVLLDKIEEGIAPSDIELVQDDLQLWGKYREGVQRDLYEMFSVELFFKYRLSNL